MLKEQDPVASVTIWRPMSVAIAERLTAYPVPVATARLPAAEGGAPAEPGLYAWWLTDEHLLSAVPTSPHPARPKLGLVYVGISPKDATSQETMRSRILTKHLGNALGSSTLRRALASLLWEQEDWHPFMKGQKVAIMPDECTALTRWMQRNLEVSWCPAARAWDYEPTLIHDMLPPLNSHHNQNHPFYDDLDSARKYMLSVAGATVA
jgi:hypothetical protein